VIRDTREAAAEARAMAALARANVRYWPTVLPAVHRRLRHWERRAAGIPDPHLRRLAEEKLAGERFNTEVAATLATLAPRQRRRQAIDAIVPLQVMYDYLDGLSEEPAEDSLATSRRLFSAFTDALSPGQSDATDYYGGCARREDDGYLAALVAACRDAFGRLPGAVVVATAAREAALRCGEAQTRTHAIAALGTDQLAEWAGPPATEAKLSWWEYTAGATASILSVHALIAAAAEGRASAAEARALDSAYLHIAAISTLLDSLIDRERDRAEGAHSFVSYYESERAMAEGIGRVVARASGEGGRLPNGGHHRMTAAGVAAYYLSAPAASRPPASAVRARVVAELRPVILPGLGIFRLWRGAKAARRKGMRRRA
jgi:tetraprenyl-beta-curcumene synthase